MPKLEQVLQKMPDDKVLIAGDFVRGQKTKRGWEIVMGINHSKMDELVLKNRAHFMLLVFDRSAFNEAFDQVVEEG